MTREPVKFLIVDDLDANLLALEGLLRREELLVLKASSGPEALELLLANEIALAIIDIQMPTMDGFELAELMRGTERTRHVPIIFLTAGAVDQQRRFRGYEAGAVDFLFKPIEPHVLRSKAGVFFDLDRQRQEMARQRDDLRLSEQKLRLALGAADMGTWVYTFADQMCEADPEGQRLYGQFTARFRHDAEAVQKYLHPDDIPSMWQALAEASDPQGSGRYHAEYRVLHSDGRVCWLSAWGQVDFEGSGAARQAVRLVGTSRDITPQKQAEEALRQSEARYRALAESLETTVQERTAKLRETIGDLEAFSYSISHDMRAPLRAMQGYSAALLEDYQDKLEAEGRDFLERIQRAAHRMDILIRDVLSYSRVAKGDVQLQPVDLDLIVSDVRQSYPQLHPSTGRITVATPLPKVLGHEAYLTQVVSNLLDNAVKFVAPGAVPKVDIRWEPRGPFVRIWFQDNGIGIAPEHLDRIFRIFGRVYSQKEYEGTGIGLAVVKKAVERMGGSIGVESEVGKGSNFWLELKKAP